jgi:hypothetical protein
VATLTHAGYSQVAQVDGTTLFLRATPSSISLKAIGAVTETCTSPVHRSPQNFVILNSYFNECGYGSGNGGRVFAYLGDASLRTVRVHLANGTIVPLSKVIPLGPALTGDQLLVVVVRGPAVGGQPEFD